MTKKVTGTSLRDFKKAETANNKSLEKKGVCLATLGASVGTLILLVVVLSFPHFKAKYNVISPKQKTLQEELQATMQEISKDPRKAEKLQVGEDISLPNRKGITAKIIGTNTAKEGKPVCVYHFNVNGKPVVVFLPGNCPQPN